MATTAAQLFSVLISLGTVPILSRLLDPSDFGLVAIVTVFTGFAAMFVDSGMSAATVQRGEITRQQVTNLFWIAVALGLAIATIVAMTAPVIAWFYGDQRLQAIALALACSYIFSALTVQHQALMRRGMQFNRLAFATVAAQVIGHGSGIAWAIAYQGQPNAYWALVFIPLASIATRSFALWNLCAWTPGLPRRGAGTRQLMNFGFNVLGSRFITYMARNLDKALIGLFWGTTVLGYYERATKLLISPILKLLPPIGGVMVPALSRVRDNSARYRRAYLSMLRSLIWLSLPAFGLVFVIADPLVLLYFGPDWKPVAPLLKALIPMAWATSIVSAAGWAFISWGNVSLHFRWSLVHAACIASTIAICVPFGAFTVACGLSVVYCSLRIPGFYLAFRGTPLRFGDIVSLVKIPAAVTAVSSLAAFAALRWSPWSDQAEGPTQACASIAVAFVAYLTAYALGVFATPGGTRELGLIFTQFRAQPQNGS